MSSKFSGFLVALKNEMPYFRAFPGFFYYSSSSMVTTCSDTRFAVLQDVGIILSGIERNNHIFCGFLSLNYPWDNQLEQQNIIYHSPNLFIIQLNLVICAKMTKLE